MRRLLFTIPAFFFSFSVAQAANPYLTTNSVAKTECSDCHMAYPPIFLPKASWEKIFGNLSNHFGEDASLDPAKVKILQSYYIKNSSDIILATEMAAFAAKKAAKIKAKKSVKHMRKPKIITLAKRWTPSAPPSRIQDVDYFSARHHFSETCAPVVKGLMKRVKIKTFAMCSGCHAQLPNSGSPAFMLKATEDMSNDQKKAFYSPAEFKCFFE